MSKVDLLAYLAWQERIEQMRESIREAPSPTELRERQMEMLAWAKSVGWL
jgi:hypothetical protein